MWAAPLLECPSILDESPGNHVIARKLGVRSTRLLAHLIPCSSYRNAAKRKWIGKGWFPASRNLYVRKVYVYKWNRGNAWKVGRKRKSWASLNFSFKLYFIFLPLLGSSALTTVHSVSRKSRSPSCTRLRIWMSLLIGNVLFTTAIIKWS